jgi:hypothetical protein
MRKSSRFTAAAVTGLLATGSTVTLSASADDELQRPELHRQVITVDTPFAGGTTEYVDLGPKDIGPGDMFLTTGVPVMSHGSGRRIGVLDGTETIVAAAHDGVVDQTITLRLRHGLVMLGGVVRHDDTPFRLAVVGGTGRYAEVRGDMTLVREDPDRKVNVFRISLHL